jgi:8-oxo-dGTP diphosphatase
MTDQRYFVDVLILARRGGEILLTERAGSIYMAGYWAVPGGKVEPGENVAAAAARELSEEVGIDLDESAMRFVGVTHHRPPHGDARVGFAFLVDVPDGVEPVNREPDKCSTLAWAAPDVLPEKTMPYTREAVRLHLDTQPFSLHGW